MSKNSYNIPQELKEILGGPEIGKYATSPLLCAELGLEKGKVERRPHAKLRLWVVNEREGGLTEPGWLSRVWF